MSLVITGKSLRIVRNDAKVAADETLPNGKVRIGRPVTVTGTKGTMSKFGSVADEVGAAIVAESNPDKRGALLTNVTGKVLNGSRVTITRLQWDALIAEHIGAVSADPENPTAAERTAARARLQSFLSAGMVVIPDGEADSGDALDWAFGIADADDADDDDDDDGDNESDADDATTK